MSRTLQNTLLSNWHPMRWVALAVGSLFVGMGVWHVDIISMLLGGFFLFQAATNTGCLCGNCAVPATKKGESSSQGKHDITYTEIKQD